MSNPPSPAPPTNEPAPTTKDTPINPNVGAIFDEIKTYTVSVDKKLTIANLRFNSPEF